MSRVLVLTNSYDDSHVDAVGTHLRNSGHELIRVDIDAILRGEHSITWDFNSYAMLHTAANGDHTNLLDVDSVWFRKPYGFGSKFGFVESIHDPVQRQMVSKEVRDIVDGLCSALDSKKWINHPKHMNQARLKPYQLHVAMRLGMNVPESIITSDPNEARSFCGRGSVVFKALADQVLDYGDVIGSIDTTLMTSDHIDRLDFIRSQPILLQRYIEKSAELRVTYVDGEIFVARQTLIDKVDVIDWRTLQDASTSRYEPWSVSPKLVSQIQLLMKELNLVYGAIDFAVDHNDQPWFLEVNPNGQWLGYTDEIGMPAAASMARLLVP